MSYWHRLPGPGEWARDGKCGDRRYIGLFDPIDERQGRSTHERQRIEQAQGICQGCPVIVQCRVYADRYEPQGVWAGEYREHVHNRGVKAA